MNKNDNLAKKVERKCYGIRLKPELVKRLKIVAIQEDKPLNHILEICILAFLMA